MSFRSPSIESLSSMQSSTTKFGRKRQPGDARLTGVRKRVTLPRSRSFDRASP
jgi:hypothetical protein